MAMFKKNGSSKLYRKISRHHYLFGFDHLLDVNIQEVSRVIRIQGFLVFQVGLLDQLVDLVEHLLGLGVADLFIQR